MTKENPMTVSARQRMTKELGQHKRRAKVAKGASTIQQSPPKQTKQTEHLERAEETDTEAMEHAEETTESEGGPSETDSGMPFREPARGKGSGEVSIRGECSAAAAMDDGGPIDKSLITSFETHVAYAIWNKTEENERHSLKTINHYQKLKD